MKALSLFSNGLDSRVTLKIMKEKYDVEAIFFLLPFLSHKEKTLKSAEEFCKKEKIKLKIIDCCKGENLKEYMNMLRHPRYGRGVALNPCIDCHIFIFKKAKEYADSKKIEIISTGEVIGQRPMSQTLKKLDIIDKELGFQVLRPLVELGISGRNRSEQIKLANKYEIDYPTPAGGCLLCEKDFCKKIDLKKDYDEFGIEMLIIKKHFENSNIIIGRNKEENEKIEDLFKKYKKGFIIIPEQVGGTAWVSDKKYVDKAKELIQEYSKNKIEKFKIF